MPSMLTCRADPFRPDIPEGWRAFLLKTPLTPLTFAKHRIHLGEPGSSSSVPAHYTPLGLILVLVPVPVGIAC